MICLFLENNLRVEMRKKMLMLGLYIYMYCMNVVIKRNEIEEEILK